MKRFLVLVVVSVALSAVLRKIWQGREMGLTVSESFRPEVSLKRRANENPQWVYHGPRPRFSSSSGNDLPAPCRRVWSTLTQLNLKEVFRSTPPVLPDFTTCESKALPEPLQVMNQLAIANCSGTIGNLGQCFLSATQYRAHIVDWMTRDKKASDISDPRVLADKVVASIFMDPGRAVAFADRLVELMPNAAAVGQLDVIARVLYAESAKDVSATNEAARSIERFEKMDGAPWDAVLQARVALEMAQNKDGKELMAIASKAHEAHSDAAIPYYFMAAAAYKEGDRGRASTFLNQAIQLDPKNTQFTETRKRLQAKAEKPFTAVMSFDTDMLRAPKDLGTGK